MCLMLNCEIPINVRMKFIPVKDIYKADCILLPLSKATLLNFYLSIIK